MGVALIVPFLGTLGIVIGNEVQANDRDATAHQTLLGTRYGIALVDGSLGGALHQLGATNGEVGAATTALTQDAAELKAAQTSLSNAQSTVAGQASQIGALNTCLGGVEQALNALSVNDQGHGISALRAVMPSCRQVTGPSG